MYNYDITYCHTCFFSKICVNNPARFVGPVVPETRAERTYSIREELAFSLYKDNLVENGQTWTLGIF